MQWSKGRVSLLVAFACVACVVAAILVIKKKHSHVPAIPTQASAAEVEGSRGLRLKGTTQAVESRAILAPTLSGEKFGTLTIVKLTRAGSYVKRGDILVEFDRQAQLRDFIDKRATNSDLAEKVMEAQQNEEAARAKDETELKAAEDSLSTAELQMQKIETLSRIDAEKAQENLEEAKATLAQLKETFDLKRKAAQASIRILQIQLDRNKETMAHAEANAALLEVHAPLDGVVVLNTIWKEGTMGEVQEGDQIRPGVSFMQVVDPSHMQVQAPVNQEDLLRMQIGEPVSVHLDAYPGLSFPGKLESIDPMGREGDFSDKIHTFAAVFSVLGHDPRLMPDLSAAIDVDRAKGVVSPGDPPGGSQ
jgi:multidrug resistance efflux pump